VWLANLDAYNPWWVNIMWCIKRKGYTSRAKPSPTRMTTGNYQV